MKYFLVFNILLFPLFAYKKLQPQKEPVISRVIIFSCLGNYILMSCFNRVQISDLEKQQRKV